MADGMEPGRPATASGSGCARHKPQSSHRRKCVRSNLSLQAKEAILIPPLAECPTDTRSVSQDRDRWTHATSPDPPRTLNMYGRWA